MAKFSYVATQDGTLSNPYRYIKAGERLESDVDLSDHTWLASPNLPKAKELPLMGVSPPKAGSAVQQIMLAPVAGNPLYDANTAAIVIRETHEDANKVIPAAPAAPATETAITTNTGDAESQQGTGNADVL